MNPSAFSNHRLLIPRWRSLGATLQTKELAYPRASMAGAAEPYPPELVQRLERWRLGPSLVTAAELVETALVRGREEEAVDAARRLMVHDLSAAPLIRAQAAALLKRTGNHHEVPSDLASSPSRPAKHWRTLTRIQPHDPLAWVELALHQTVSGSPEAAAKSMLVARQLAPNNRHVLRSAARLYIHMEEPDRAHDLLSRNPATRGDPWLLSAEIAIARLADRSPRFIKFGTGLVDDGGFHPGQITELAGSIGTLHLLDGNRKRSRRMFATSMLDPTGSALAQGEWATPHIGAEIVPEERLYSVFEAAEATAFHLYRLFRFEDVPKMCVKWAAADPFSVRPFEFGSTAAGYTEDFDTAERLAGQGLRMKPSSPVLLNIRAFALASLGRTAEATTLLQRIPQLPDTSPFKYLAIANAGLCAFREGRLGDGLQAYLTAIEGYRRMGRPDASAMARVFLAKEAGAANHPDAALFLVEAEKATVPYKDREAAYVLARLKAEPMETGPIKSEEELAKERKLNRLRSVTFTTPGIPGPPRRLML